MSQIAVKSDVIESAAAVDFPTYIIVTFWGEEYRRYFLDYCLPSMMAPGNIPAIRNKAAARLLIATRDDDWQALQSEPIFIAAKQHIAIEQVRYEAALETPNNKKMSVMSQGHKLLVQRMFKDRARGVVAHPDMILADGAIRKIEELAGHGYKAIQCISVRFANEGLVSDLRRDGRIERGKPIICDAEELARLSIKHMHSETVRLEFEADIDDQGACSFFWVVTPGQNLLFHSANWVPLMIDYGSMETHDKSTLDEWTLDGDYIAKNFSDARTVYTVPNTAELFFVCFTPEAKLNYRKIRLLPYRFPALRTTLKVVRSREYMRAHGIWDAMKKQCYQLPIRVQGGACSEAVWRQAEQRAAEVVARISEKNALLTFYCVCWSVVRICISRILRLRRRLRAARLGA